MPPPVAMPLRVRGTSSGPKTRLTSNSNTFWFWGSLGSMPASTISWYVRRRDVRSVWAISPEASASDAVPLPPVTVAETWPGRNPVLKA